MSFDKAAYMKEYYQANKEKINARHKEYYQANKEKINSRHREYNQANKEEINAYRNEYNKINKEKVISYNKEYRKINKEKIDTREKEYWLKEKYGMTLKDKKVMLKKQNNKCKICSLKFNENNFKSKSCIDHCHTTNKIRGLLCPTCNSGLGFFKDNTNLLINAITYLAGERNESSRG